MKIRNKGAWKKEPAVVWMGAAFIPLFFFSSSVSPDQIPVYSRKRG
jgi:hypothetical protein